MHREPRLKWYTEGILSATDPSQCWHFYFCRTTIVSSQDENCTALIFSILVELWLHHSYGLRKKITALVRLKEYLTLCNVELCIACVFFKPKYWRPADSTEVHIYLFTNHLSSEKEKMKEGVVLRDTDIPAEKQAVWSRNLFFLLLEHASTCKAFWVSWLFSGTLEIHYTKVDFQQTVIYLTHFLWALRKKENLRFLCLLRPNM